ncbi:hypothetical protein [Aquimarina sp. I32.4]|uniref:hypothetical protein n=1 Tax=Aquimarina sp. I32.4 TaxID=2053903 RepID=UPI000CDF2265|nr:hypothetical protein [Aquimarina sp. I32.4]
MRNPNELASPHAVFLSIREIGKLFSPPISRQKLAQLKKSGILPLKPVKIDKRTYYHKEKSIALIEHLCEVDMSYDLNASL